MGQGRFILEAWYFYFPNNFICVGIVLDCCTTQEKSLKIFLPILIFLVMGKYDSKPMITNANIKYYESSKIDLNLNPTKV